jgi:hypothetical protein
VVIVLPDMVPRIHPLVNPVLISLWLGRLAVFNLHQEVTVWERLANMRDANRVIIKMRLVR